MITYVVSNLLQSPAKVLVNTVNTVGVMGKGIAKDFKEIYPEMFKQYQLLCERNEFKIGQLWLYKTPHKWILNLPTKKHWRYPSKPEFIEAGLKKFVDTYAEKGITSISFPLLGCGNGGLDWETQVRPIMEKYLEKLPIEVFIHLHKKPLIPEHNSINEIKEWLRCQPEALAFNEVWDDLIMVLSGQHEFTIINKSTTFSAYLVNQPEQGISIITADNTIFIHCEQLLDLWQHLRGFGFCMDQTLPCGLEKHAPYLFALLSQLTYLKPVLLGKKDKAHKLEIGLQLIPKADYKKCGLLKTSMEVKRV